MFKKYNMFRLKNLLEQGFAPVDEGDLAELSNLGVTSQIAKVMYPELSDEPVVQKTSMPLFVGAMFFYAMLLIVHLFLATTNIGNGSETTILFDNLMIWLGSFGA